MMSIKANSLTLVAIAGMVGLAAPSLACQRHFYNNSSVVWFIAVTDGACHFYNQNGPSCMVGPHQTATLDLPGENHIVLWSPSYNQSFYASGCKIGHSGNTGSAVLNEPADGDVTAID